MALPGEMQKCKLQAGTICIFANFKTLEIAKMQTSLVQVALVILYLRYMLPYKAEG